MHVTPVPKVHPGVCGLFTTLDGENLDLSPPPWLACFVLNGDYGLPREGGFATSCPHHGRTSGARPGWASLGTRKSKDVTWGCRGTVSTRATYARPFWGGCAERAGYE